MEPMRVPCPSCKTVLKVPPAYAGKKGRCKQCGSIFRLLAEAVAGVARSHGLPSAAPAQVRPSFPPAPGRSLQSLVSSSPDDRNPKLDSTIMDLAAASHAGAPLVDAPPVVSTSVVPGSNSVDDSEIMDWLGKPPPGQSAETDESVAKVRQIVLPKPRPTRFAVRLGHVDNMGAFFLFDPSLLRDERFRLTFPQKCVLCGSQASLMVHLVFWQAMLPHAAEVAMRGQKDESKAAGKVIDLKSLAGKVGGKFLEALGRIDVLPEPYCLPFPYYICQVCSPSGAVVTDVRIINQAGQQECELGICSPARAEEFAISVCGPDCQDVLLIRQAIRQRGADPWQMIPLAVQSRIRKWYKPDTTEKFIAYIPDAEFARMEDGGAGLVLTDHRIIQYRQGNLIDIPLNQQLTIARMKEGQRLSLHILSASGKHATMAASVAGAERLRHCFVQQGVKAKWS